MATQNIAITESGWQNLTSDLSLTEDDTYTITLLGGSGEICIAESTPAESLKGHPITNGLNFNFTYKGTDAYIKVVPYGVTATVVFS